MWITFQLVSIDAYANLAMDGVVAVHAVSISSLSIVVFASIVIGNCNTDDLKAEHRVEWGGELFVLRHDTYLDLKSQWRLRTSIYVPIETLI